MANITVSSAVDNMLQGTNNSNIRQRIGALSAADLENISVTFGDDITFDSQVTCNDAVEFNEDVNFESTTNFQDDMEVSNITVNGEASFQDSVTCEGSFECEDETVLAGFSCNGDASITSGDLMVNGPIEIEDDSNFTMSGSGNFNMQGGKIQGPSVLSLVGTSQPSSPQNGMIIYNSSAGKFQGYANGGWVNLH